MTNDFAAMGRRVMESARHLLKTNGAIDHAAIVVTGDLTEIIMIRWDTKELKAKALATLNAGIKARKPDAVIMVTDTWIVVETDGSKVSGITPSTDPRRIEAVVVTVITPSSTFTAIQEYSRVGTAVTMGHFRDFSQAQSYQIEPWWEMTVH